MTNQNELLPKQLDRTVIYECPWVNLYCDRVQLSTGHIIEQYHCLDFGLGTATAIVENEAGQILMTKMARYHPQTIAWELPAGRIDDGETPIEAARREVLEETGYETYDHRLINTNHPIVGISDLESHIIYCRAGEGSGVWDENEVLEYGWFSMDELLEMVRRQEIPDGYTVLGILLHHFLTG